MNFLAAPFGSQEANLLLYGVQGVDYAPDSEGIPAVTAQGRVELTVPWKYLTANPSVLFDPTRPKDFATWSQEDEKAMTAVGIPDPTLGLYSATYTAKNNLLNPTFYSGVQDIVSGSRPLTDLDTLVKDWRDGGGDASRTEYERRSRIQRSFRKRSRLSSRSWMSLLLTPARWRVAYGSWSGRLTMIGTSCSWRPPCERRGVVMPERSCLARDLPSAVEASDVTERSPMRSAGCSKMTAASSRV